MCDYPITPLPPYTNKMYEQFARDFGRTAQEQMEADTITYNGIKIVQYSGYIGWVNRMTIRYLEQFVQNASMDTTVPFLDSGELLKFTKNYLDFYIGGMGY